MGRFASVYLNKCFDENCTNPYCFPRRENQFGKPVSFLQAIEWMLANGPTKVNTHWAIQSFRCELKHRLQGFNVVALMNKTTLAHDASCLMNIAGLEKFNHAAGKADAPFWRPHEESDQNSESYF